MISKKQFLSEATDERLMIAENELRDMCDVRELEKHHRKFEDVYVIIAELREKLNEN